MTEQFISSIHIQKLGHKILEIRERALQNIISKLNHGFMYDNDLARSKEILAKLFEWFLFEQVTHEEVVLKLIKRILQTESGKLLIQHYGPQGITTELKQIESYIEKKFHCLVEEIVVYVKEFKNDPPIVPPLESDLPLSYRTGDESPGSHRDTSKLFGTTASSIRGFIQQDTSQEQKTSRKPGSHEEVSSLKATPHQELDHNVEQCLPFYHLSWQPLVAPDRHVLESIEQSLRNPPQPSVLIHSCEFFTDVMLQDFPAEVFLQRPNILSLFLKLLASSTSTRLNAAVLTCLLKLVKSLLKRISYYSDPCTHNLKQNVVIQMFSGSSRSSSAGNSSSERSSHQSSRSTSNSDSEKFEDTALLKTKQLPLPNFCIAVLSTLLDYLHIKPELLLKSKTKYHGGFNIALELLENTVILLGLCMKQDIWNHGTNTVVVGILNRFNEVLIKFGDVLEYYRVEVTTNDFDKFNRVVHLCLLHNCIHFLQKLIPYDKLEFILPRNFKNALSNNLLDASFARLYPLAHDSLLNMLQQLGGRYENNSLKKYEDIKTVCKSMSAAIKFIKSGRSQPVLESIGLAIDGISSLEFHKSLSFVKSFIEICANKIPQQDFSNNVLKAVEGIILTLLSHTDVEIKEYSYKLCQQRVIAAVGPKLNTSKTGAPGTQIQFILRPEILLEVICHGVTSESKEIQRCSEDILIHILKCKILVSDSVWNMVLDAILPILPILVCLADKQTPLGRTVMNILDPDVAQTLTLPSQEVFKGNAALLFSKDAVAREETISRLCWLLSIAPDGKDMLPRLTNLRDKALSKVCQHDQVGDLNKLRGTQQFYQASSVQQILDLLNSENIEPVIRRSAMTQLAVMLEDPLIHTTFIKHKGINILKATMRSALIETSYQDYPDSIIPAISILKNITLYNSSVRQELSEKIEVYQLVLRGMFLFCAEDRVKQEGSILLFMLLYGNLILGSPSKADLSIPKFIMDSVCVPFKCSVHWLTSKNTVPSLRSFIAQDVWCLSMIQIHWNSEWYGGFKNILKWNKINYTEEELTKFDKLLRLSNNDLIALKNSNLQHCIKRELENIQNASSHEKAIEAFTNLTSYIRLFILIEDNFDIFDFPWEQTLDKFLSTVPSGNEDVTLLTTVLIFLRLLIPLYKLTESQSWIVSLLKNPHHSIYTLLEMEIASDVQGKLLNREILGLIMDCACAEQNFLDFHIREAVDHQENKSGWTHVIEILAENLKFNDSQHFYNLAYLDCLLTCLVHLTASLDWSKNKNETKAKELISQLITNLCELIGAFHCSKGSTAPATLMGLSITRHAVLILNQLLAEMQYAGVKSWDMCFIDEDLSGQKNISSLCALWMSRCVILRTAVIQLFAGLCISSRAATHLINEFYDNNMNLLDISLNILLDHEEASIVRESVAMLLGNLISHTVNNKDGNTRLLLNFANKDSDPTESLLLLLDECQFYKGLEKILSSLYTRSLFYCDPESASQKDDSDSTYFGKTREEYTYAYLSSVRDVTVRSLSSSGSKFAENTPIVATPGFIKAITIFINNLLPVACEYVLTCLQEAGLIKLFFRTVCSPAIDIENTKDLSLYCDVLQMNAAICHLLKIAVSKNFISYGTIIHTRDCLNVVISSLDPSIYHTSFPQLLYLRNKLWIEIFGLISALIDGSSKEDEGIKSCSLFKTSETLNVLSSVMRECGQQPFLQALCESIGSNTSHDLQQSALSSLTSLLKVENSQSPLQPEETINKSMKDILDSVRTPRTPLSIDEIFLDIENVDPKPSSKSKTNTIDRRRDQKMTLLESIYFGNINNSNRMSYKLSKEGLGKKVRKKIEIETEETEDLLAGAEICKILMYLYDICSFSTNIQKISNSKKFVLMNALSSLLCVSHEAKKYALDNGFLEIVIKQLREIHIKLSLESVDCLRRIADKKRVCPLLKELDVLIGLVTNFLIGDLSVKCAAVNLGVADVCHKLWIWFGAQKSLLVNVLKFLCTFTTNCNAACQSLPCTSIHAGSGPRKSPSNLSLLHAILALIGKEMEQVSKTHDLTVLSLSFHLLHNVCSALECRVLLSKSSIFGHLTRLHPAITKKQKPWENIELLWLNFLETFTSYPEGQACVTKIPDVFEIITSLTATTKGPNKRIALLILRNIAFYQPNKTRLLTSDEFLNILRTKMSSGSIEEKNIIVMIMWALAANSQKAKLILKCAGLDVKLKETLKFLHISDGGVEPDDLNRMHYVLSLLQDGEKTK